MAEFRGSHGLGTLTQLVRRHPGMSAWRDSHARLLRGESVPAPLALLEERRLGLVLRSYFVSRWE